MSAKEKPTRRYSGVSPYMMMAALLSTLMLSLLAPGFSGQTISAATAASGSLTDLPPDSVKVPPMVKERSISTYVPSSVSPGNGIAVNMIYPQKSRYKDGAPVCVVIPGGITPNGLNFEIHAAQVGVIEVRFAFPGGGTTQFGSSGAYDVRGPNSITALKDVIEFAGGKKQDYKGRLITDLLQPVVKAQPENIGLVGWDNGGNQALVVLGKHPQELSFVKWLAFYESPVGSMFWPPALGCNTDLHLNNHYRQGSAATGNILIDYRKLNWAPESYRNPNRLAAHKRGKAGLKGVLFFDENHNNIWEESNEYAFTSALDVGLLKQYFPPQVAGGMQRVLFGGKYWPPNIATVNESEEFFSSRDGSLYVEKVAGDFPDLMVTMFGSKADHFQQQPDHPHICFLYNLFLTHKVRFLRLNPDPNYMVAAGGMNAINFVGNKPNSPIESDTILNHLESEGLVPDYVYMEASVAELADRTKGKIFKENLNGVIVDYTNGASEAPKPEEKKEANSGGAGAAADASKASATESTKGSAPGASH